MENVEKIETIAAGRVPKGKVLVFIRDCDVIEPDGTIYYGTEEMSFGSGDLAPIECFNAGRYSILLEEGAEFHSPYGGFIRNVCGCGVYYSGWEDD